MDRDAFNAALNDLDRFGRPGGSFASPCTKGDLNNLVNKLIPLLQMLADAEDPQDESN